MLVTQIPVLFLFYSSLTSAENKFMGGAIFLEAIGYDGGFGVMINALLGWKTGYGHCIYINSSCELKPDGWGYSHSEYKEYVKTFPLLGNWTMETFYSATNTTKENITGEVGHYGADATDLVNVDYGWEQEFVFMNPPAPERIPHHPITVKFNGSFWSDFNYDSVDNLTYSLSAEVNPLLNIYIENGYFGYDNISPYTLFQPLYRISLNQVTVLRLTTMDLNGDHVVCVLGKLDNPNAPPPLPKIKVNKDCTIELTTMERDGYIDGGVGIVAVNLKDYRSDPNNATAGLNLLSSLPVQFMIQTVKSLQDPVFVSPTYEDGHMFDVYEHTIFEIPVYAKAHPGSNVYIQSFNLRMFPEELSGVNETDDMTRRELAMVDVTRISEDVRYATFSVNTAVPNYPYYSLLAGVSILNEHGQLGIERHYIVNIIERYEDDRHHDNKPQQNKPYFVDPTDWVYKCHQYATCVFTVHSATNRGCGTMKNITMVYTSIPEGVHINRRFDLLCKSDIYNSYISFTSSSTGDQIACFELTDDRGVKSDVFCVSIKMTPKANGTTPSNTSVTSSQCVDAADVNCQTLDAIAGICNLTNQMASKFCPRYCGVCHDTICTTCTGLECLLSPKQVSCPPTTPHCLTTVDNSPSGAATFTKSCAAASKCVAGGSGSSPADLCDKFDPMQRYYSSFSCTYCCSSDKCNAGGPTVPRREDRFKIDSSSIVG